MMYIIQSTVQ